MSDASRCMSVFMSEAVKWVSMCLMNCLLQNVCAYMDHIARKLSTFGHKDHVPG
jgi:hypothetical protein